MSSLILSSQQRRGKDFQVERREGKGVETQARTAVS